jgi:GT2 family glycosyltransferase
MKRVVVVVLNWNGWQDTIRCVESLELMTYTDFGLLLVDNGSTDRSVEYIQQAFSSIDLLQTGSNLGFGGGCNVGIRSAIERGAEYVWLINSDATVDPDALSALVKMADQNPVLGSVGSILYEADQLGRIQLWGGGRVNLWLGTSHHCRSPGPIDFVSGASVLLRCAALQKVGLFDETRFFMYWEDTDLAFRLRNAGWQLAVATDSRIWHKQSASLGKGSLLLDQYATQSCVRFLRRHAPVPLLSIVLMLLRMVGKRILIASPGRIGAVLKGFLSA